MTPDLLLFDQPSAESGGQTTEDRNQLAYISAPIFDRACSDSVDTGDEESVTNEGTTCDFRCVRIPGNPFLAVQLIRFYVQIRDAFEV